MDLSKTKGMIKMIREQRAQESEICQSIFSKSSRKRRRRVKMSPDVKVINRKLIIKAGKSENHREQTIG